MPPAASPGRDREQALLEVVASIMTRSTVNDLFEDLTEKLSRFVQFDRLVLLLHDEAGQTFRSTGIYSSVAHQHPIGMTVDADETPAGEVIREQTRFYIPDLALEERYPNVVSVLRGDGLRGVCYLPLTSPTHRVGVLIFGTVTEKKYSEDDLDLMERAMKPVAIAVENILNRQQVEAERDRLKLLLETTQSLLSKLDTQELFDAVSHRLQGMVSHDFLTLALWSPEERQLCLKLAAGSQAVPFTASDSVLPLDNTPGGMAFEAGELRIYDYDHLSRMDDLIREMISIRQIRCMCSIPLMTARGKIGVISFGSCRDGAYTPKVVEVLRGLAGQLGIAVDNSLAYGRLEDVNRRLKEAKLYLEEELAEASSDEILGVSPGIRKVLQQIETVAPTDATVLVYGETGSGKELVARALHQKSPRSRGTFVKLNCAAIPTGLLESELFGHERGAFTGAIAQKLGRFEIAHQGTLFLDEIGEIPLELQPKLLRVLQEKEFERLGGVRTIRSDARLVAATNRDLKTLAETNQFRRDLYYRLNVFPILVPPLRERKDDIATLALHFTQEYSRRLGRKIVAVPSESVDRLVRYHWPGNIRELQNLIERSVILTTGDTLRIPLHELDVAEPPALERPSALMGTMEDVEKHTILTALRESSGVIGGARGAAAKLGMKRTTLLYRMEKLGIRKAVE